MHISRLFHIGRIEAWAYRMLTFAQWHAEERMYAVQHGPLWVTEEMPADRLLLIELHLCVGPMQVRLGRSVLQ